MVAGGAARRILSVPLPSLPVDSVLFFSVAVPTPPATSSTGPWLSPARRAPPAGVPAWAAAWAGKSAVGPRRAEGAAAARPGTTDETTSAAATRAARRAGMRFTLHSYGPSPDRGNRTGAHWHHKGSAPGVGRSGSYSTNQSPIPGEGAKRRTTVIGPGTAVFRRTLKKYSLRPGTRRFFQRPPRPSPGSPP